jgi:hypothetical protein
METLAPKPFLTFIALAKRRPFLKELETDSGTVTGQKDLTQYITDFYSRLYTSDASAPGTTEAQDRCWTQRSNQSLRGHELSSDQVPPNFRNP